MIFRQYIFDFDINCIDKFKIFILILNVHIVIDCLVMRDFVHPIVCGSSLFVFVLLCITLCPFQFCNHLKGEEKAGCFAIIVLHMYCYYKCSMALPHSRLQCVIVVFTDHTYFLFCPSMTYIKLVLLKYSTLLHDM